MVVKTAQVDRRVLSARLFQDSPAHALQESKNSQARSRNRQVCRAWVSATAADVSGSVRAL